MSRSLLKLCVVLLALCGCLFARDNVADLKANVEHVVIFMQENRAFDHYYGTLEGVRGFDDRAAITLPSGLPVWYQPVNNLDMANESAAGYMLPWHMDTQTTNGVCANAPAMNYITDILMWNNGLLDAWNTARDPGMGMSYFEEADLPFYYSLSREFLICDQYHQSTFTQTNPNRLHLFSGSNGLSVGELPVLDNTEPKPGFNWPTLAEILEKSKISWKVYQQKDNFDDNAFAWFEVFQNAKPGSPLYDKGLARQTDFVEAFSKDVADNNLPQVSILIAPANMSEHANHKPPFGEDLTARILQGLSSNSELYKKTVFLLNYDEGGQFFDHGWTPTPPTSADDGSSTVTVKGEVTLEGQPIGLGFRVPMIVISPWTRGNLVNSQIFDHTSVIQLLEKRFDIHCPNISPWRRAMTGDLLSVFDFENPDYSWPNLPNTSKYVEEAIKECSTLPPPHVPVNQSLPHQQKGTRTSRALPYVFHVEGTCQDSALLLNITVSGAAGSPFYAYDDINRAAAPKKFAVEAGKTLVFSWAIPSSQKDYSVTLHGPNGFVRQMKGSACHGKTEPVSLAMEYDARSSSVRFVITNREASENTFDFSLTPNAYYAPAELDTTSLSVVPGQTASRVVSLANSGNWYDFTITAQTQGDEEVVLTRRYMGRMETGKDSISDPSIQPHEPRLHPSGPTAHPALKFKDTRALLDRQTVFEECAATKELFVYQQK